MRSPPGAAVAEAPVTRFIYALARFDKPLVAAVDGPAVGLGDDAVLPLRPRLRGAERALPHAVRRSRPGAGSGIVAARAAALRPRAAPASICCSASRSTPRRRGPADWSTPSSTPPRSTPMRSPRPRRSPPSRVRRCSPARRLMRGDEAAVLARMDEEVRLFQAALRSPEAQAAFMAFMSRSKG